MGRGESVARHEESVTVFTIGLVNYKLVLGGRLFCESREGKREREVRKHLEMKDHHRRPV